VEAESVRGSRRIPVEEFFTGVKRNALAEDELIKYVHIKKATGPQQFSKIGTRNAMVIAVCGFSVALHPESRRVRAAVGSAAPTPFRATEAEDFLSAALDEEGLWDSDRIVPPSVARRFAELCSAACKPIDDVRGSAAYRRHAVGVMARRTLTWVWESYRNGGRGGARNDEGGTRCA
jgi:CO/xanthine dehydrogenase FAD-binding subunit